MKRFIITLLCIPVVLIQLGCSRQMDKEESGEELYVLALKLSDSYHGMIPDIPSADYVVTKSDTDEGWGDFVDLPQDIQFLFIDYMSPDNISNWDELSFCSRLSNMQSITNDDKDAVIHGLALCMVIKSYVNENTITKGGHPEEDCRSAYYHKVKSILLGVVGATVAGCIGGLAGAEAACVAGLCVAIAQIEDAGAEYVRCWA